LHLDAPRRALGALRDHDLEHPVPATRLDSVGVGAVRQREAPVEHAVRPFDAGVAAILLGVLGLALAADGEDALVHAHFDVLRVHARDVGEDQETILLLADVDARHPLAGDHVRLIARLLAEEAVEQVLDLLLEQVGARPGVVADDAHRGNLLWDR
jgi:hypothetical protein